MGMIEPFLGEKPMISVVVLDFHGRAFWPNLAGSLESQSLKDFELIVVDNGGEFRGDSLPKRLSWRSFRPPANLGFAGGVNAAVELAWGEFLVFLNNDTIVDENWLKSLHAAVAGEPEIAAVCSKVIFGEAFAEVTMLSETLSPQELRDSRLLGLRLELQGLELIGFVEFLRSGFHSLETDGSSRWVWTDGCGKIWLPVREGSVRLRVSTDDSLVGTKAAVQVGGRTFEFTVTAGVMDLSFDVPASAAFDVINNAGSLLSPDWFFPERGIYSKDEEEFNNAIELEVASACSLMVRRSALDGPPFDPAFFAYCEDVDLCLRLRKNGYRIVYEPKSVVRHHRSGTSGIQSPLSVFYGVRNRFWVIAKHAPMRVVWKVVTEEMWKLGKYEYWLDEEYSLRRLYWSTWTGFVKRFFIRILDLD